MSRRAGRRGGLAELLTGGGPSGPSGGAPLRDVFLVGSSYSGTTHIGGLLEANLDAAYLGETAHLPAFVDRFRLFDAPLGCLLCSVEDRACPRWSQATVDAVGAAGPPRVGEVLRARTGTRLLIDGSKWPEWLRQSLADRPAHLPPPVAVVTARSPFGYVLSARGATQEPAWVVAGWWRDVYIDTLRTLNLFGIPAVTIRNEDVRTDPASAVARVARLTGQEEPSGPLRPAVPTHSIGGNLFVQHGYRPDSRDVLSRLGIDDGSAAQAPDSSWEEHGTRMATDQTTTASQRPRTRAEALAFVSDVTQTPGLVAIAQTLGYSIGHETDRFLGDLV